MAEAKKDYYEVLGVSKGAGDDEIKKAYRRIAKECHPDLHPDDKHKEQLFKQANEAYEVLSDSDKKARYDQFGHAGVDPSYGAGDGAGGFGGFGDFDLGSIFESFFGGFGSGSGTRSNAPRKGDSLRTSLVLSFEEAAFGAEKTIGLSRVEKCDDCGGSGAQPGSSPETCPVCKGAGQVKTSHRTPLGIMQSSNVCSSCNGRGKIIKNPCAACKGAGMVRHKVEISVKVPAGIDDRQTVSIRGQGNAGLNGGPPGDVLVTISVRPHPFFAREGTAVHCEFPITFSQAALGSEAEVPTLDGKVKLSIPEGTQNGAVFTVKGKGIPGLGGKGRGDQYVHVQIEVPKNLSRKQKELLEQFAEACDEKNHPKRKGFFDKLR